MQPIECIYRSSYKNHKRNILTFCHMTDSLVRNFIKIQDFNWYLWGESLPSFYKLGDVKYLRNNLEVDGIDLIIINDWFVHGQLALDLSKHFHVNIIMYDTHIDKRLPLFARSDAPPLNLPYIPYISRVASKKDIAKQYRSMLSIERYGNKINLADNLNDKLILINNNPEPESLGFLTKQIKEYTLVEIDAYNLSMGKPLCFINMFNDLNEDTITAFQSGICVISEQVDDRLLNFVNFIKITESIQSSVSQASMLNKNLSISNEALKLKFGTENNFNIKFTSLINTILESPYRK